MFTDPICFFLIALSCLFQVSAGEECCKRTMLAYPSGEAIPPECERLRCTEAPIIIESSYKEGRGIQRFLRVAEKISTLTVIDNSMTFIVMDYLKELVHKGPGPAIFLRNVEMLRRSFDKLQKITVDDIRPYCKGEKLIVIEGTIDETVRKRLETIANQTLADCAKLTTLAPSTTTEAINTTTVTTEAPTTTEEAVNTTTTIATTTEPEINTTTVTTIATTTPEPTTRTTTAETLVTTAPDTTVAPDEAISSTTTATKSPPQNCVGAAALAPAAEEKECPSTNMIILPAIVVIILLILALGIVSYVAFFIRVKPNPENRTNSKNNSKEPSSLGIPIEGSKEGVEAPKRKAAGKDSAVLLIKEEKTREETPKMDKEINMEAGVIGPREISFTGTPPKKEKLLSEKPIKVQLEKTHPKKTVMKREILKKANLQRPKTTACEKKTRFQTPLEETNFYNLSTDSPALDPSSASKTDSKDLPSQKKLRELCLKPDQTYEQSEKIIEIEKERASTLFSDELEDFEKYLRATCLPEEATEEHKGNPAKLNAKI